MEHKGILSISKDPFPLILLCGLKSVKLEKKEGTNNSQDMLFHLYDTLKCDAHFFSFFLHTYDFFFTFYLIKRYKTFKYNDIKEDEKFLSFFLLKGSVVMK